MPWMFVTSVCTGSSTISRTPTAAARWIDDVAAVHELVHDRRLEHGVDDEVEVAALAQVRDVPLGAGRQVVEDEDLPAVGEQQLREMRADEAGAAGDQGAAARSVHAHGRDPSRGL